MEHIIEYDNECVEQDRTSSKHVWDVIMCHSSAIVLQKTALGLHLTEFKIDYQWGKHWLIYSHA